VYCEEIGTSLEREYHKSKNSISDEEFFNAIEFILKSQINRNPGY